MAAGGVATVRRFSRVVTQRLGALNEEYLARPRPLGASRVLYEVGEAGADARAIRSQLGLDSGYLSRLLRRLEDEHLVTVEHDADDRRVRVVRLTEAGRAERAELDRRSDELARTLLDDLDESQRGHLIDAMATVERLLTAQLVEIAPRTRPVTRRGPACSPTSPSSTRGSTTDSTRTSASAPRPTISSRPPGCSSSPGSTVTLWVAER